MKTFSLLLGSILSLVSISAFAESNSIQYKVFGYNIKNEKGVDIQFCKTFISDFSHELSQQDSPSKHKHEGREVKSFKHADNILMLSRSKALGMGHIDEYVTVNKKKELVTTEFSYVTDINLLESKGLWKNKFCSGAFMSTPDNNKLISGSHFKKHINYPNKHKKFTI